MSAAGMKEPPARCKRWENRLSASSSGCECKQAGKCKQNSDPCTAARTLIPPHPKRAQTKSAAIAIYRTMSPGEENVVKTAALSALEEI